MDNIIKYLAGVGCRILIRGIFCRARISRINAVYTADIRVLVPVVRVRVTVQLLRTCARFAALLRVVLQYGTLLGLSATVQYSYNPPIYGTRSITTVYKIWKSRNVLNTK